MALVVYKNQSDYALLIWLSQFPTSGHPLDEQRFMVFAKSVARYRNKKWLDYSNFYKVLSESGNHFEDEEIESYHSKLVAFVRFHKTPPIQSVMHEDRGRDYGYYQRGVIKGKIYEVPITEAEYRHGATKNTLKNAEFI